MFIILFAIISAAFVLHKLLSPDFTKVMLTAGITLFAMAIVGLLHGVVVIALLVNLFIW